MARDHGTNDYGTSSVRSHPAHRPAILVNHAFHWLSALIVLGISAYFIHKFGSNTHLRYWVALAAIDVVLYIPALVLPALKSYKGYLAPVAWILSYLWLTAFIFAAQDYNFHNASANSPAGVNKPHLKKTLEAFAFLAFFTSLVGQLLEGRLLDIQQFKRNRGHVDKHHGTGVGSTQPALAPDSRV